jgi:hypothetical protein
MGKALIRDLVQRVSLAADVIGIRGVVVHAISEEARRFHLKMGFDECPGQPMVLVVRLADLRAVFAAGD